MIAIPVIFWSMSLVLLLLYRANKRAASEALRRELSSMGRAVTARDGACGGESVPGSPSPALRGTGRRLLRALSPLASRLPFPVDEELLAQAGSSLDPEGLQAMRLIALVSFAVIAMGAGGLPLVLLASFPAALLAWLIPVMVLKRRLKRQQAAISDALPTLLDLLSLLLMSGQNIQVALRKASQACSGPLRRELEQAFRAMELGVPRQQAFGRLGERNACEDLKRFVRVLQRAERFGAPLAAVTGSLASEMRHRRKMRLQESARKAPVKILFPLVFLILPSFLLLTVGGMMLGGRFL
jgi:Flp pilus assembly protein TadB